MHRPTPRPSLRRRTLSAPVWTTVFLAVFAASSPAQTPTPTPSEPEKPVVMSVDPQAGVAVSEFLKLIQRVHGGILTFDVRAIADRPPIRWEGSVTLKKDEILAFADQRLREVGLRLDHSPSTGVHTVRPDESAPESTVRDKVFPLRHGRAAAIARTLREFLDPKSRIAQIAAHPESNHIIARADADTMRRLERLVSSLDFPSMPAWKTKRAFDCDKEDGKLVLRIYDPSATTVGALLDTASDVLDRGIYYDPVAAADAGLMTFAGKLTVEPEGFLQLIRRLLYTRGYLLIERDADPGSPLEALSLDGPRSVDFLQFARKVPSDELEAMRDQTGVPIETEILLPEGGASQLLVGLEGLRRRLARRDLEVFSQAALDDRSIVISGLAPEVATYVSRLRRSGAVGTKPKRDSENR